MSAPRAPEITNEDGVTVVSLGPEYENLDEHGLDDIKNVLLDVASNAEPPRLVLDLSHTNFFGSAFIEILFRVWNRVSSREEGRFAVSGLTEYCAEVIGVTHLDRLWEVFETRSEAVRALQKP